ncbi:acyl-CoA synthetase [Pollutimonas nitritireducens]|uniref:Acyl-CoA synthetase n=1 Tax=Pollutimonas nitritireducens TaxID=2045209 RepID=A0A2N4UB67_9BURK|nr:AMP-binding protein [Pollutimonas nitritireducens]PLC52272.1 acyl-CoA synthetase [Pollutimonas nitritireducens]
MVNLSAQILYHAASSPEKLAIVYDSERITYGEFATRVLSMAGYLQSRGVEAGQVVAVVMKNSTAFLEIAYALSHIGGVFLPVNFRLSNSEVAYILEDAEAKLLIADEEFHESVQGILDATVLLDEAAQHDTRKLTANADKPGMFPQVPEDLFRLMYTSGTTDRPKGVMHTYQNYYWKCLDHIASLSLTRDDILLVVGPLYHVGAFDLPGTALLYLGGTLIVQRNFDENEVLASIDREKITCAWLAPVMAGRLLSVPDRDKYDLRSFKWCIGGGEKTPENRIQEFSMLFPCGRYIDAYGLTESCGGDTFMEPGREIEKIGSTGRAVPHLQISIVDDNGMSLPAGQSGEICLRGPKVTKRYWKQEEKTRNSFFGDWFRTGDVGYLDEDGFLFLTDRKKDMIISGGENVASSEVERVIFMLPQIADVAVIGLADERWGESVAAVAVLLSGHTLELNELAAHCRKHLASFKVPKRLILLDELPRNPSGKVLKRVLRAKICT